MAQYKDKNGHWFIVCTSPITHKKTTIRKNPLKQTNLQVALENQTAKANAVTSAEKSQNL